MEFKELIMISEFMQVDFYSINSEKGDMLASAVIYQFTEKILKKNKVTLSGFNIISK